MRETFNKSTISQIGRVVLAVGLILVTLGFLTMYDPRVEGVNVCGVMVSMLGTAVIIGGVVLMMSEQIEKHIKKSIKKAGSESKKSSTKH